ncbi:hypothetical protein [Streptomyces sp. NPDC051173]|uniref:hypothetical protein n=1 Tax=Streptomyces sp. NPDC051173 TaxID=3155164 RepID=UPI003450425E
MIRRTELDAAERFRSDTSRHQMTVLHNDGLYRHLRFMAPKSSAYWFDLVTWPGSLAIRGDVDGYMFTRLPDMFEFFRGDGTNPHYWSEKTEGGRSSCTSYSESLFRQLVVEHFVESVRDGDAPRGLGKAVREGILDSGQIHYEDGARAKLDAFEYKGYVFPDTWDWDFHDYNWSFLWSCHAIVWGIGQYDVGQADAAVTAAPAGGAR